MKKSKKIHLVGILIIASLMGGCNRNKEFSRERHDDEVNEKYVCTANMKLEAGRENEAGNGKTFVFIGNGNAYRITNYFAEQYSDSETEVVSADALGMTDTVCWSFDETGYVTGAGCVALKGEFTTILMERGQTEGKTFRVETRGKTGLVEKTIKLDLQNAYGELGPETVTIDAEGYIHLAGEALWDDNSEYQIYSPEGEKLWSKEFSRETFWRILILPDGSVAVDSRRKDKEQSYQHQITQIDVKTGEESILFQYAEENDKGWETVRAVNRLDQDRWLLVKPAGIYACDKLGKEQECLYSFKKHGIEINDVMNVSADAAGNVSLLIQNQQGAYFLYLVPAPEEIHMTELAVPKGVQAYNAAVAEFNLRHPDRQIVIRDDFDKTQLLTMLVAGDGPTMIDSRLVSFRDQTEYWEALNELYDELGLTDVLNEAAVKLGAVDHTYYGIVLDFYVQTLISASEEENWNYEAFLRCMEKDGVKYVMDNAMGESKEWIACGLLDGGVENSLYFDINGQDLRVNEEALRKALQLIRTQGSGQKTVPYAEGVNEGEVLCNLVYVFKPSDLIFYHQTYGEKAKIKGFPRKNGAKNLISSSHVCVIRKTASAEEKETAREFAKMLLSKEMQAAMTKEDDFQLSIRTDVLKEQVFAVEEKTWTCPAGFYEMGRYLEQPDNEANYAELTEIIKNSVAIYDNEDPYKSILEEEFSKYFAGEQSEDTVIDHLKNRIRLYIRENDT